MSVFYVITAVNDSSKTTFTMGVRDVVIKANYEDLPASVSIENKTLKLDKKSVIYNGKAQKVGVSVKGLDASNYTVKYENNTKPGIAKVIVTGKNGYHGTLSAEFKIVLGKPVVTVSNVESTGKIKLSWKKFAGADKYQVYRGTSKTGKYTKIATTANLSCTNTSATAGKIYYYKVKALSNRSSAATSEYSLVDKCKCK